jgi:protein-tyrosine phosphatase
VDEVPDPYYGGESGFENVLNLLEEGCLNLVNELEEQLSTKK